MTWRFTLEDRMAFQKVRRILAELMSAGPSVGLVKALRQAHAAAQKAAYPTHDEGELAVLRTWMGCVQAYLDAPEQADRRAAVAGVAHLVGRVADILGLFPTPPPGADAAAQARAWWLDG